jgi:SAM-dependent methyltransferase
MDRHGVASFQEYLEAKRLVDLRCINRRVLTSFRSHLEVLRDPAIVDLGTGTGLMIRKIIRMHLPGKARIIGIDLDGQSCRTAVSLIAEDLVRTGYREVRVEQSAEGDEVCGKIDAERGECGLQIEMRIGDVLSPGRPWSPHDASFDAVTANAFIDLMPLKDITALIGELLTTGGLFYATINYDGTTTLLPPNQDGTFETELLDIYNCSMEMRRTSGKPTGGSRSGSRLFGVLLEQGFNIVECGSSDWAVVPKSGRYRRGERTFLRAILQMLYGEGRRSGALQSERLDRWMSERLEALEAGTLSLITHQIDVLARKE